MALTRLSSLRLVQSRNGPTRHWLLVHTKMPTGTRRDLGVFVHCVLRASSLRSTSTQTHPDVLKIVTRGAATLDRSRNTLDRYVRVRQSQLATVP
ncbi:hypothetical protein NOCA2270185 [metagenome]|uniref:Uncharacterized protein n=1 Tax=metagenome TaxID=256318 RepID=A0A2P2C0K2_9ZZZZ